MPWAALVAAPFSTKFLRTIRALASVSWLATPESIRPTRALTGQAAPVGAPIMLAA